MQLIWIHVVLSPATSAKSKESAMTKAILTEEKKKLVKLLAAFAIATKHHLRAEAGIMHADLEGASSSLYG
jgi:putative membrane protein